MVLECSHVDVVLRTSLSLCLKDCLEAAKQILKVLGTRDSVVHDYANDTVREAGVEAKYSCLGDIGSDGDTESSLRPKLALGESCFAVGLAVGCDDVIGVSYVAGLDEWVLATIEFRIVAWAVLGFAAAEILGDLV